MCVCVFVCVCVCMYIHFDICNCPGRPYQKYGLIVHAYSKPLSAILHYITRCFSNSG